MGQSVVDCALRGVSGVWTVEWAAVSGVWTEEWTAVSGAAGYEACQAVTGRSAPR